jgi:hypothetical protein
MLTCRQAGKSTTAGGLALKTAMLEPGSLVLLLSPTLRQSAELLLKVRALYDSLGRPVPAARGRDNALRLELSNGSRIISLPGSSDATVRGFSKVALLVIDEAARVADELMAGVRPMLAVSGGKLVMLSTPWSRDGFFFREWTEGEGWHRVEVRAHQVRRITPKFLAEELRVYGPRIFSREYECAFIESEGAAFDFDSVKRAMVAGGEPPLFV